jgi:phenylacetate-coenzyme A ligase PaaK-like adenylate-forming protein
MRDAIGALKLDRAGARRERWSREQLLEWQAERVDAIARHAATHSAFYRERLSLPAGRVRLADLPVLDKATFVDRFDAIVTDPRLRRDELLAHAETLDGDDLYLGRYRVMATSGSSGRKGLFVYDRPDWQAAVAGFLRATRLAGVTPRIPRSRLAQVGPPRGVHMSRRMSATMNLGLQKNLFVPATAPIEAIVEQLNRYQPTLLVGFPSLMALLAREQIEGRLRVSPETVGTASELVTPSMRSVIAEAWGQEPFNFYGITEAGMLGADCDLHRGIHVNVDYMAVEVVDRELRPVPDGEVGDAMLITSLDNHVQPTLRLAVTDRVAIDPEPCPCGRPMPLLRAVEGRADDVIHLRGRDGRSVPVIPLQFAPVAHAREVREFQIVQEGSAVRVRVVLQPGAGLPTGLQEELGAKLRAAGVADPEVTLEAVDALPRDPAQMGKLKLVVADSGEKVRVAP